MLFLGPEMAYLYHPTYHLERSYCFHIWSKQILILFFFFLLQFFFHSDGVGRSGVAATVMSAIEKLKNEQTVDVLQTVNLIRVKRPFAVSNVVR